MEEKDARTLFKKKEFLDMLEKACDKCQSTANVIISFLIKNSYNFISENSVTTMLIVFLPLITIIALA